MRKNRRSSRLNVHNVLAEFDVKRPLLIAFCDKTKGLIEDLLDGAGVRYYSVQARVKSREKLKRKYLDPQKDYKQLDDIMDQAALRVITYHQDEVQRVVDLIKSEFEVDPKNSVDKRDAEPNKFGYHALNYVCKYPEGRRSLAEYRKFADVWCEIQVTSILGHAWSEIEHPWYDMKESYPDGIKRRFARVAALLEIAESEFQTLRDAQRDYERSVGIQVEADVPDVPVDGVSIKSFIEQQPLVREIDRAIAAALDAEIDGETTSEGIFERRAKAARLAGLRTLQEVSSSLGQYGSIIPEFTRRAAAELASAATGAHVAMSNGMCVSYLSLFLACLAGRGQLVNFLDSMGVVSTNDPEEMVTIAATLANRERDR